ncbi:hypothetical protein BABINDRAFT_161600 [Babjeviella inositovora NRRL Y-12698]|uniref:N-acetyltransferase ECO1 n=1 Tax=Babjeviella inositovora NRRL Y-12698 TaxID=984486 RepID=A0A1E3QR23_9ASCO|nr:uncharacterized protein BABINDRAFT_161600 [Babjeviella inositovora NRRL Y-12698]ODQ79934.1 hypothetical protein BABINDRAFT_161600 [Babjeviella inositovora NRRL Y-12698]
MRAVKRSRTDASKRDAISTPPPSDISSQSEVPTSEPISDTNSTSNVSHPSPPESLASSPMRLRDSPRLVDTVSKGTSMVQSYLALNVPNLQKTCPDCNMSYRSHLPLDRQVHAKHHDRAVNGRDWQDSWGKEVGSFSIQVAKGASQVVAVLEIDPLKKTEVRVGDELLHLANVELNAPQDSGFWKLQKTPSLSKPLLARGKVYVCVLRAKVIGLVSFETSFPETKSTGRWMILRTGQVIPNQEFPILVGISRIFVMKKYRRNQIAAKMLRLIQAHSIYGIAMIKRQQIAFSQPSSSGGQLAKKFNGVLHKKSGEWLVPVYLEY